MALSDKARLNAWKAAVAVVGFIAALVAAGFLPKISDIATIQEVQAVDTKLMKLDERQQAYEKSMAELLGEVRAIRQIMEENQ